MAQPSAREQTTLRLPDELLDMLRRQARERGMSLNSIMVLALYKGLEAMTEGRFSPQK